MLSTASGRCPTIDRRRRDSFALASGGFRFLLEKRDVVSNCRCWYQPGPPLGHRSQATRADLLIDDAAAHGQDDHGVLDPVKLLAPCFAGTHMPIALLWSAGL